MSISIHGERERENDENNSSSVWRQTDENDEWTRRTHEKNEINNNHHVYDTPIINTFQTNNMEHK